MSTTLEQVLEALGYDPELCSPDPVAWARGFRERFDIVTRQRDAAERECEALRKELQRVSAVVCCGVP